MTDLPIDPTAGPPADPTVPVPVDPTVGPPVEPVPTDDPLLVLSDRILALEGDSVHFRQGVVTQITPTLSVAVGGSAVAYTSVSCIEGVGVTVGDTVACLAFGADLIVLGTIAQLGSGGGMSGEIKTWALPTIPTGWIECNGQSAPVGTPLYAALVAAGNPFGSVAKVPNLTDRFVKYGGTLGQAAGAATVSLAIANMPAHDHGGAQSGGAGTTGTGGAVSAGTTGSGGAVNQNSGVSAIGNHYHGFTAVALTPGGGTEAFSASGSYNRNDLGMKSGDTGHQHSIVISAHTHSTPAIAAHTHTTPAHTHTIASQGSGTAFSIEPLHVRLRAIIKL